MEWIDELPYNRGRGAGDNCLLVQTAKLLKQEPRKMKKAEAIEW